MVLRRSRAFALARINALSAVFALALVANGCLDDAGDGETVDASPGGTSDAPASGPADAAITTSADAAPPAPGIDPTTMFFAGGFFEIYQISGNTNALFVRDYEAIHRLPRDGAGASAIVPQYTAGFLVDDANLFWNDTSAHIWQLREDGGGPVTPFLGGVAAGLLAQDALALYVGEPWVGRALKDGSTTTTLTDPSPYTGGAEVDDTWIYYFENSDPSGGMGTIDLRRASKLVGTGEETLVVNATAPMGSVAIFADATHVYWFGSFQMRRWSRAVPHTIEDVPIVSASIDAPAMAQNDTHLYFIGSSVDAAGISRASVWAIDKSDLTAHELASTERGLGGIAVDATGVYVGVHENRPQWERADWIARLPLP